MIAMAAYFENAKVYELQNMHTSSEQSQGHVIHFSGK